MATIIFSAAQPRLSVRGPWLDRDLQHLLTALETFRHSCPQLVREITGVGGDTSPHGGVVPAVLLAAAVGRCHSQGLDCACPDGAVERMLQVTRGELEVPADRVVLEQKAG